MKKLIIAAMLSTLCLSAFAAEVDGVKLDDKIKVGTADLTLNGACLRKKAGLFKVYVAGLYLPAKTSSADAVIGGKLQRRVTLVMKRDVEAETLLESFHTAIKDNLTGAEFDALKPKLAAMDQIFKAVKQVEEGDIILLDFDAEGGTRITVRGQVKQTIPGADLSSALLKIWLGKQPVQEDLKKALLAE